MPAPLIKPRMRWCLYKDGCIIRKALANDLTEPNLVTHRDPTSEGLEELRNFRRYNLGIPDGRYS